MMRPWILLLAASAVACTRTPRAPEPAPARRQPLINGVDVNGWSYSLVRLQAGPAAPECTGTLMADNWVLTAAHCLPAGAEANPGSIAVSFGGIRPAPDQTTSGAEVIRSRPFNLALIRLAGHLNVLNSPTGLQRRIYYNPASSLAATLTNCLGWGAVDDQGSASGLPRTASLLVVSADGSLIRLGTTAGARLAAGDAGGLCHNEAVGRSFAVGIIVGVDGEGNGVAADLTKPEVRSWIETAMIGRVDDVSANAASPPAAALTGAGAIAVFWVDGGGNLLQKLVPGPDPAVSLGSPSGDPLSTDAPAAIYLGNELHALARSRSGALYEWVQSPGAPPPTWTALAEPGTTSGNVSICFNPPDRFDAFVLSASGSPRQRTYRGGMWGSWSSTDGQFDLGIAAIVPFGPGRIDGFGTRDGHTWHKWSENDVWVGGDWEGVGGAPVASTTALVTWDLLSMDMFARHPDGHLLHDWFNVSWVFTGWTELDLDVPGPPAAVVAGSQLHLFATNADSSIWHAITPR